MARSTILSEPFNIYEVEFFIGTTSLMHLAGADMGGINRIIPMPDGTEMPHLDARGTPIGRAMAKPKNDRMAMIMISVFANSPHADTLMKLVLDPTSGGDTPNGVSAEISAQDGSGVAIGKYKVEHVVFSYPPYDFDSGSQAMVFQGIGWGMTYEGGTSA